MCAVALAAGLLFLNVYTSVVDAPNWGHDIPNSLIAAREYFKVANPGTFFRIFSPANQVITLLALIACWRAGRQVMIYCGFALLLAIAADVMTFAFFYPRNDIMFVAPLTDTETLKNVWSQWTTVNWIRSAVCLANLFFDFAVLLRVAKG